MGERVGREGESRDAALWKESNNKRAISNESSKETRGHTVWMLTLLMVRVSFRKTVDGRKEKGEKGREEGDSRGAV